MGVSTDIRLGCESGGSGGRIRQVVVVPGRGRRREFVPLCVRELLHCFSLFFLILNPLCYRSFSDFFISILPV